MKILLLLIVSIAGFAYNIGKALDTSEPINLDSLQKAVLSTLHPTTTSAEPEPETPQQPAMTEREVMDTADSDPHAVQKYVNSRTVDLHSTADKLMNLLTHGKFE